ncbi:interleukin-1 receptor type 2 isoform X3 [Dipodomys spectabilis]|uniref:interleukin-1 receptor type 2 isoform X3 n=1 Tax=Dipodomys spectabilis TaxID=105255 RepID=UPI001C535D73|nr:interleukin-1 receptor type 2 isoform X3 [Dipodomys spectabilis]
MQSCRRQGPGPQISTSSIFQKLLETMFILYILIVCVSALTTQPEEQAVASTLCQFHGKHYKAEYRLEGEPVVLKCPLVQSQLEANASSHILLTWRKNNSAQLVPRKEPRMWVGDGALWLLPALREDSDTYICTVRNASQCGEMSTELRVFMNTKASLKLVSYVQVVTLSTSGMLVCPDLRDFLPHRTDAKVRWYKDSVLLDENNSKFVGVGKRLVISNASMEDMGYFTCVLTFSLRGREYNVSRNIELLVKKRREETIPVIVSPLETVTASLGSKLTIPCKVFLGPDEDPPFAYVQWMANNSEVPNTYPGGRLMQGDVREYSENNESYIEVPLLFNPVTREDLHTDFTCKVNGKQSHQVLRTTVKEASPTFSWKIALAPLSLVILVLGGMWMHRWWKDRAEKHIL